MEDETAAAAASGLLDNTEDNSQQEDINNQNESNDFQDNQEQKPVQKEGENSEEEDLVGKNIPLHKHPRFTETRKQLREERAKREEIERKLATIESRLNSSSPQLDETIKTEIAQVINTLPKRDFGGKVFNTWEEAYPFIRDFLIEDVMSVSKFFATKNQSAQAQQESQKQIQDREWAEELVEIEDEIDNPDQYKAFRLWTEQQLTNKVAFKSFNDAYNKWLSVKNKQIAQKPGKPNVNKQNATKVLTNGKPNQSKDSGLDYRYIASHSMSDIADRMTQK